MQSVYCKRTTQSCKFDPTFADLLDVKLSEFDRASNAGVSLADFIRGTQRPRETAIARREAVHDQSQRQGAARRVEPRDRVRPGLRDAPGQNQVPCGRRKRVVRDLPDEEECRLRAALVARDNARRAAHASANKWRRERGYAEWASYNTYTDYVAPLVLLAVNTGLRRGELLQLRWRDLHLQRRILTVRGDGPKTRQTRDVPLNSEATRVLKAWRPTVVEPGWCVFGGSTESTPLGAVKKAWHGALQAAAVTSFRFHDLRHTFASKLVMAGVDLNTVRELLGHKSLAMTLRYAHLAPEYKAAAVEALISKARGGKAA
jgi:integrase